MLAKAVKAVRILLRPPYWRPLLLGTAAAVEHLAVLHRVQVATLLDVGANTGQFSMLVRHMHPGAQIVAFEPLADAAERFERVVTGNAVTLHRMALGAAREERELHVTSPPDSSSLLAPGEGQFQAYGVRSTGTCPITVVPLAAVVPADDLPRPVFLKIDVQGGELDVLKGAGDVLDVIDWIYLEVSFVVLYSNQPLAGDIVAYLVNRGFELRGVFNQSITEAYGPTQADLLFSRRAERAC